MNQSSAGSSQLSGEAEAEGRARARGAWYFVITVLTAGLLAAVPFWHAWSRLRESRLLRWALLYTAADVALFVLLSVTPDSPTRGTSDSVIGTIGGLLVCAVVVGACIQLRGIRRQVYATPRAVPVESDPAVVRALASRERREEARKMWNSDPALARELGIGRPDLGRGFDDGGLFELNSAPAAVIAAVCGLDPQQAEAIVAARKARGGSYFNLGELFVDVPLPEHVQRLVTERALV